MSDYAAFVSYAHRYKPWVEALQKYLEACLKAAGASPHRIFLDTTDLASGRSWVGQLQAGLSRSEQLILVVTPEALASPRVADEWGGFIASRRDWLAAGQLHLAVLVDTPLPPFLEQVQQLDFRAAEKKHTRRELGRLVARLLGRTDPREVVAPPVGVALPQTPVPGLPPTLRRQLVEWMAVPLAVKALRLAIASSLKLNATSSLDVEFHGSWRCVASALLVHATGDDEPVAAALRVVDILASTLDEEPRAEVARLAPLRAELEALVHRGPGRGLLALWLRQVAEEHGRLVPYFERQGAVDLLEKVYVQLELRPESYRGGIGGGVGEPGADLLAGRLDLRQALALQHPWVTGRWVILGDPGAGKTTLLRHLAATLANKGGQPWVPLFESLPRLVREGRPLLDRAVRSLEVAGQPAQGLKAVLEREADQGRLLLLLDGLDEVPQELRDEAERLLRNLESLWPKTPIVVTSRPIGFHSPGGAWREMQILPLDRERRLQLLDRWLGSQDKTAERALAAIDTPELRDLAGNPLYLTLMALLVKKGKTPERNRTALYDQVFDLLLEGDHRGTKGEPLECQAALRELLGHLALGLTEDNRDEPVSALEARLYRPELDRLRATLERVPRWRGRMRQLLEDVAERTGILGPHDGPQADWRFWHRTFREALAAERLAAEAASEEGLQAILDRARVITIEEDLSRWAEPFALLVGRVAEPDALVRTLVQANQALGLRAVATAQNLQDETLREILSLTEKWKKRREVYARVPDIVGEPRRALALLDQLRRKTRNGNDLFFLDEAVRQVARRWPEEAAEAARLLSRFYDHIPAPPESLFLEVETPLDGRVLLWREIPAGEYWMGSAKNQGNPAERPHHRVTIERAFACAAVPVTWRQYRAFDDGRSVRKWQGVAAKELLDHPVGDVNWYEAVSFCRWLAAVFPWARGARLPLEEEWEYFCRAGTTFRYWSGDGEADLDRVGWYSSNSKNQTHRVGEKAVNPWGLYDVHGNVWEWTLSPWTDDYRGAPSAVDFATVDAPSGGRRVMRGGSYWDDAVWARAAFRYWDAPEFFDDNIGFRVALPAGPEHGRSIRGNRRRGG